MSKDRTKQIIKILNNKINGPVANLFLFYWLLVS